MTSEIAVQINKQIFCSQHTFKDDVPFGRPCSGMHEAYPLVWTLKAGSQTPFSDKHAH